MSGRGDLQGQHHEQPGSRQKGVWGFDPLDRFTTGESLFVAGCGLWVYRYNCTVSVTTCIVQELCESRGGRPGLSVVRSHLVSVDVKIY